MCDLNVPGRQYFLAFVLFFVLFVFTSHNTVRQNKQNLSPSPPRLHQSVSTCASPFRTQGTLFAVTERQYQHFRTSSRNSCVARELIVWIRSQETRGTLRRNAKARVHLAPFAEPLAVFFFLSLSLFSTVPNEETAYAPACGRLQEDALHPASFVTELVFLWAQTTPSCERCSGLKISKLSRKPLSSRLVLLVFFCFFLKLFLIAGKQLYV